MLKDKASITKLLTELYGGTGRNPSEIDTIRPLNGADWTSALSFMVIKKDGDFAFVTRCYIDTDNRYALRRELRDFHHPSMDKPILPV